MDVNSICPKCLCQTAAPGASFCNKCGYDFKSEIPTHVLLPKTILNGKYLVGSVIGEGGFGITYIGMDLNLELKVAIKEFYPNGFVARNTEVSPTVSRFKNDDSAQLQKWQEGFLKEARSLGKFSTLPGVVSVRDFFTENNTAYIVMEYVEGVTLKEYLKNSGGKIGVEETLNMIKPIIHSLSKIHAAGIVHRDISPDNIMIQDGGEMKLIDFGAAREFSGESERSLSIMLKPAYAPEEQYRTHGNQGPWTDVYAICATIYRCITGVKPVESMERMRQDTLKKPSELGVAINPKIEKTLMEGMAVFAENRIKTMQELEIKLQCDDESKNKYSSATNAVPVTNPDSTAPIGLSKLSSIVKNSGVIEKIKLCPEKIKSIALKFITFIKNHKKGSVITFGTVLCLLIAVIILANVSSAKNSDVNVAENESADESVSTSEPVKTKEEIAAELEKKRQAEELAKKKKQEEAAKKLRERLSELSQHYEYSLDLDESFRNAYISKVKKSKGAYSKFDLHHIDGDDIPELVMGNDAGFYEIIKYADGRCEKLYGGDSSTIDYFFPYDSLMFQSIKSDGSTQYVYLRGQHDHYVLAHFRKGVPDRSEIFRVYSEEINKACDELTNQSGHSCYQLFSNLNCGSSRIIDEINYWSPQTLWIGEKDDYSGTYQSGYIGKSPDCFSDFIRVAIYKKTDPNYYSVTLSFFNGTTLDETYSVYDVCLIDGRYEGVTDDGYRFTLEATMDGNLLFYSRDYSRIVLMKK